jgi:hypothetical protein
MTTIATVMTMATSMMKTATITAAVAAAAATIQKQQQQQNIYSVMLRLSLKKFIYIHFSLSNIL